MANGIADPYFNPRARALVEDPRLNPVATYPPENVIQNWLADLVPGGVDPSAHRMHKERAGELAAFQDTLTSRIAVEQPEVLAPLVLDLYSRMDPEAQARLREAAAYTTGYKAYGDPYIHAVLSAQQTPAPMSGMEPTGKTPATRQTRENPQGVKKGAAKGGRPAESLASQAPVQGAPQYPVHQGYQQYRRAREIERLQGQERAAWLERIGAIPPGQRSEAQMSRVAGYPMQPAPTDVQVQQREQARADELAEVQPVWDPQQGKIIALPRGVVQREAAQPGGTERFPFRPTVTSTSAAEIAKPFGTEGSQTEASRRLLRVHSAREALEQLNAQVSQNPDLLVGTPSILMTFARNLSKQAGYEVSETLEDVGRERQGIETIKQHLKPMLRDLLQAEGRGQWSDQRLEDALGLEGFLANPNDWAETYGHISNLLDGIERTITREVFYSQGLKKDPLEGETLSEDQKQRARIIMFRHDSRQISHEEAVAELQKLGIPSRSKRPE